MQRKTKNPPCFHCGRQLYGNKFTKLTSHRDQFVRTFHKSCAVQVLKDEPEWWEEWSAES